MFRVRPPGRGVREFVVFKDLFLPNTLSQHWHHAGMRGQQRLTNRTAIQKISRLKRLS
jgi:hypothetical protein